MGICAFCAFALIAGSQYESLIVQQQTILKIAEWAVGRGGEAYREKVWKRLPTFIHSLKLLALILNSTIA